MASSTEDVAVLFQLIVGSRPVPETLTFVTKGSARRLVGIDGVLAVAVFVPFEKFKVQEPRFVVVSATEVVNRLEFTPSFKLGKLTTVPPGDVAPGRSVPR